MKRLASLYWRHEAWGLRAVVSNEPFNALIRFETLLAWYATPVLVFIWLRSTFVFGYFGSSVLMSVGVVSLAWAAFGIFSMSYCLIYVAEAFSFNSPVATEHPKSQKRRTLLESRLGAQ